MPELKESELANLTPQEIKQIIGIIDVGPHYLERVNRENIDAILDNGTQQIQARRTKANDEHVPKDASMLDLMAEKDRRQSGAHAIQCAINPAVDAKFYLGRLAEKNIPEGNKDAAVIKDFFNRLIKINGVLAGFFRADVIRRIGKEKQDSGFFEEEQEKIKQLFAELPQVLNNYEAANKEKILSLPEEEKIKVEDALAGLRAVAKEPNWEELNEGFYDDVCMRLSFLIETDYKKFNKDDLFEAAKNLDAI